MLRHIPFRIVRRDICVNTRDLCVNTDTLARDTRRSHALISVAAYGCPAPLRPAALWPISNATANWGGSSNLRFGIPFAASQALPYAIGDVAYGDRKVDASGFVGPFSTSGTFGGTGVGWNAGGGLAAKIGASSERKRDSVDSIADTITAGRAESVARGILQRLKQARPAG
jgi:hypothetical protein